ncbi:MAG TPA: SAM-dependent methyltransferase, partial [Streptomyces sp.]|nr:SAM-dependent methyltransferase [Streptomyces sp.]
MSDAAPCPPSPRPAREPVLPDGLSKVSLWTAAAHAAEAGRSRPYLDDPWAADFLYAARFDGGPPGDGPLKRLLPDWAVVRSRFFDEFLQSAARSGCRQVVLLGAGFDTRAYRLDWPTGVHVFEVEAPAVLAFKERVLDGSPPSCGRRTAVPADPAGQWAEALLAAGFDLRRPTAWLAETHLYHLPPPTVEAIVATMTRLSAPGSVFGAECVHAGSAPSSFVTPFVDALAATGIRWHWQVAEPHRWWLQHHWDAEVADLFTLPYAVERLSPYLPLLTEAAARCVFLTT